MSTTVMQEDSRSPAQGAEGGDPEPGSEHPEQSPSSSAPPKEPAVANRFVGHAMRALFESSDVSIRRGDETRVMSRAQEAFAEIQRKTAPPPSHPPSAPTSPLPAAAKQGADPAASPSSRPPAPRVDPVLWIVLAAGLFAIAGWMILYALT
jgi:hypothetical protein